jgi:hypothetical protein
METKLGWGLHGWSLVNRKCKCHEMFGDRKRWKVQYIPSVEFLCLKNKKWIENNLGLLKYARNTELAGIFTSKEHKRVREKKEQL